MDCPPHIAHSVLHNVPHSGFGRGNHSGLGTPALGVLPDLAVLSHAFMCQLNPLTIHITTSWTKHTLPASVFIISQHLQTASYELSAILNIYMNYLC